MPKVLIVDDNADLRLIFEWVFQENGFDIQTASDGQEALDYLSTHAPDVIILDVNMPKVSGLQVAEMVRASEMHAQTRIIFVTGNPLHSTSPEVELGDLFLVKPVEVLDLVTMAQRVMGMQRATPAVPAAATYYSML